MSNFDDLLNVNMDDVKAPEPLPAGEYNLRVVSWEPTESSQKKTPGVNFEFAVVSPGDDVDEEALPENWQQKKLRGTFWVTENALFMLKNFFDACGVEHTGKTIKECLPETIGAEPIGVVTVEEGNNGPYNPRVERFVSADE